MTLKQELLAAVDAAAAVRPKLVTIKGFPKFYVRGRSVGEVDVQKLNDNDWIKNHTLTAAAALVICDEEGTLLFDADDPADIELMKKFEALPWAGIAQKIVEAANSDVELEKGN